MLKSLNKNDILVTPFTTTQAHRLSNVDNSDLILFEHTSSDGSDIAVAIEYIDYGDGYSNPVINSSCSLANDAQSLDKANVRGGENVDGLFYPESDPINLDSTYKRLVYHQVSGMFYNNYRDPSKMWGMEEIDFDKSQTKKFLADGFVMLDIPPRIMGEKILPNTVRINDTISDDNYVINDDGKCNLVVGTNVFSKHQELGDFSNLFATGSDGTCDGYFNSINPPEAPVLNSDLFITSNVPTVSLDWTDVSNELGYVLERSISTPSSFSTLTFTGQDVLTYEDYDVNFGFTYYYRVFAYNSEGSSSYSNIVFETISAFDPVRLLTGSMVTQSLFDNSASAYLTWSNVPVFPCTLSLYKSDNIVYPTFTIIANPFSGSTSYLDVGLALGYTYYYKLESSNSLSSSFTNEVALDHYGSVDTFEEYPLSSSNADSFTGSYAWGTGWNVDAIGKLIAFDNFEPPYTLGQTSSFSGGFVWVSPWVVSTILTHLIDPFEEYTLGQTSSFNSGSNNWSTGSLWTIN